jgi:hypothetical protein
MSRNLRFSIKCLKKRDGLAAQRVRSLSFLNQLTAETQRAQRESFFIKKNLSDLCVSAVNKIAASNSLPLIAY